MGCNVYGRQDSHSFQVAQKCLASSSDWFILLSLESPGLSSSLSFSKNSRSKSCMSASGLPGTVCTQSQMLFSTCWC